MPTRGPRGLAAELGAVLSQRTGESLGFTWGISELGGACGPGDRAPRCGHLPEGHGHVLGGLGAAGCAREGGGVWGPAQAPAVPMGSPCTGSLLPAQPPVLAHVSPNPASRGAGCEAWSVSGPELAPAPPPRGLPGTGVSPAPSFRGPSPPHAPSLQSANRSDIVPVRPKPLSARLLHGCGVTPTWP